MARLKLLKRIGYSDINTLQNDDSAFFYESGFMIDADGAYHAYHPDNRSGLDYLGNAGRPGNWWALVTDNRKPSGNPVIQSKSDPAPGFYISTTTLEDSSKDVDDPRESPGFDLLDLLRKKGACVSYNDPHIPSLPRMRHWPHLEPMQSVPLTPENLADQDCVLIATDHSAYDYDFIVRHSQLVIDTRNATKKLTAGREKIVKA